MKRFFALLTVLLVLFTVFHEPVSAQTYKPALVMSPDAAVQVGARKALQLSLVNMGVPLRSVEVTVRLSGDIDEKMGLSFAVLETQKYGLTYKSHYFTPFPGKADVQDMVVVFEASSPQGYNQGSAQVPLVEVTYTAVPGVFSAMVVPEKTKITGTDGNLLPSIDTFGTTNYTASAGTSSNDSYIRSYSLSFESDPVKKWWPTAPNSVQQIDAALWKDGDGNKVQQFMNIDTVWQVDSSYLEIKNTSSSYFDKCPVPTAGGRPCLRFAAHVVTKKPGKSSIMLKVINKETSDEVWNSYPLEIFSLTSPYPTALPSSVPSPMPAPTFIPEDQVSAKEFEEVQQKVTYLQSQLDEQQQEIKETRGLLARIVTLLKRIFGFK